MAKKRVMTVDDEPDIRALVKTVLEKDGYEVVEAKNGDDCVRKLKKDPNFDLVLLDVRMPGMPPREVIENINKDKSLKKLKVVYLTVVDFAGEAKKNVLKQKQVVGYMTKPFSVNELAKQVKKTIG
jgi:two-component system response regulator (stage 0 sporulation protein F)